MFEILCYKYSHMIVYDVKKTKKNLCFWSFHFIMWQIFSIGERSGLQANQFSIQTLLIWSCVGCSMWFNLVVLKYAMPSLIEMMSGSEHVALELLCTLQHWWSLSRCASCSDTSATPYHQRWRPLNCPLIMSWISFCISLGPF